MCEKDGLESHFDKEAEVLLKNNIEKKCLLLKNCKTPFIWDCSWKTCFILCKAKKGNTSGYSLVAVWSLGAALYFFEVWLFYLVPIIITIVISKVRPAING